MCELSPRGIGGRFGLMDVGYNDGIIDSDRCCMSAGPSTSLVLRCLWLSFVDAQSPRQVERCAELGR